AELLLHGRDGGLLHIYRAGVTTAPEHFLIAVELALYIDALQPLAAALFDGIVDRIAGGEGGRWHQRGVQEGDGDEGALSAAPAEVAEAQLEHHPVAEVDVGGGEHAQGVDRQQADHDRVHRDAEQGLQRMDSSRMMTPSLMRMRRWQRAPTVASW